MEMGIATSLNEIFVTLFHDIMDIEEKGLVTEEFKDISVNDMHVLEAIGCDEAKSMGTIARSLEVTLGTLTTAMNGLVKKGYVTRLSKEDDRRVVLVALTEKGLKAHQHHMKFHEEMIRSVIKEMSEEEMNLLEKTLQNLSGYFNGIREEMK